MLSGWQRELAGAVAQIPKLFNMYRQPWKGGAEMRGSWRGWELSEADEIHKSPQNIQGFIIVVIIKAGFSNEI